jgi:hypothetical protein
MTAMITAVRTISRSSALQTFTLGMVAVDADRILIESKRETHSGDYKIG